MARSYASWGQYPKAQPATALSLPWRDSDLPKCTAASLLPFGNGRSYGDSCQNGEDALLDMRSLDRFIAFDPDTGVMRAEAGVMLGDVLETALPHGWFLPVTPGTQFVTLGGAVANDVHGKNHHKAGTFGCHVRGFELLRTNGERLHCTTEENAGLFRATIGGLGLTGIILWVELSLKPVAGPVINVEAERFSSLDGFYQLSAASVDDFEYTVAWIDCLARGKSLGRGWFYRANHSDVVSTVHEAGSSKLGMPFTPPLSLVNRVSLGLFNGLYYHLPRAAQSQAHYQRFFYPLDGIRNWNRMYGPKGFLQYQCVVPEADEQAVTAAILERISAAGMGSFLVVLKRFGNRSSPGLLSFPRAGTTLALDFPNRGQKTLDLLNSLDSMVTEAGGAVYPAKDARMSAAMFHASFPGLEDFCHIAIPGCRRVSGAG